MSEGDDDEEGHGHRNEAERGDQERGSACIGATARPQQSTIIQDGSW